MLDFNSLLAFSHTYCVAICATLVPFNLLTTLLTLVFIWMGRPKRYVWQSAGATIAGAAVMVFHVLTWLVVGVVMLPTFVLMWLSLCCLTVSLWALTHPTSLNAVLRQVHQYTQRSLAVMAGRIEAS